jgi:hypothetical protein
MKYIITLLAALICGSISAQNILDNMPTIGVGSGVLIFNGDVSKNDKASSFCRIRAGYNITVEKRFGDLFGVALNGVFGKLAGSEYSETSNLNFESKIAQADLSFIVHTDIFFSKHSVTPYAGAGIGFLSFDPYGDLYDKNGKKYNYWSDGSVRDKPETTLTNNASQGVLVHDYKYETQLKDATTNYARHSMILPLTIGVNFKFLDNLDAKLGASYYLTFSDYIDNVKANGNNDSYLYINVGLSYKFVFKHEVVKPDDKRYDNVDFSKFDDEIIPKDPKSK